MPSIDDGYGNAKTTASRSSASAQGAQYQGNGGDGAARARRAAEAKKRASAKASAAIATRKANDAATEAKKRAAIQAQARMQAASRPQEQNTYQTAPSQLNPLETSHNPNQQNPAFYPDSTPANWADRYGLPFSDMAGRLGQGLDDTNPIKGLFEDYSNFNPLGAYVNQHNYGMNEPSKQEYLRQEQTNPNWANMSEKERVHLAKAPYMSKQLPHAYLDNPNESQLAAMKPQGMPDNQWNALSPAAKMSTAGVGGGMFGGSNGNGNGTNIGGTALGYGNGGTSIGGGANVSGNNGQYFDGGYTGDAVNQLSQARSPRGMEFGNIYGSTKFDPLTGQFIEESAPEYQQFQQGLLGQLQGSQEAYQSFDPNDAASEYLRGVNAIREPLREQQTESALSRLVQSGKLGSTVGTQALAQLATEQENQRFQEGIQATQYGANMQDRMLRNQAGMFGLTQQVADQQFKPQQQALGSVPMLQEIYGFAQEPQFQQGLAQQGIQAQASANNTANWMGLGTSLLGTDVGQDLVGDAWGWLTDWV
jgi:hypothetical protein